MAIGYKIDVLAALSAAGYSSYKLRREKLMGESTRTKIRSGGLPSWHELDTICRLLHCQPGDIVEYIEDADFTKVTPAEAAALQAAEDEIERGEVLRDDEIDWDAD